MLTCDEFVIGLTVKALRKLDAVRGYRVQSQCADMRISEAMHVIRAQHGNGYQENIRLRASRALNPTRNQKPRNNTTRQRETDST